MRIAYCEMTDPKERFRYRGLQELASSMNISLERCGFESHADAEMQACWTQFQGLVDEAESLFIPNGTVFLYPGMFDLLHARIAAGARAVILLDENDLESQNAFLSQYDLTGTRIRIRKDGSPTVRFSRSGDCLRDLRMFVGVDEVLVQQPNAIWYGGESYPFLVGGDDTVSVSDGETDFLVDWNSRELASIAAWHSADGGGVLAIAGNCLTDAYTGITGHSFPGIEANASFAKNLLVYLHEGRPSDSPEDHCKRVEINIADFALNQLKLRGANWWNETVSEKIRQKCDARRLQEQKGLPVECYLDLIDLKVLIEKNWASFESLLQSVGCDGGKRSVLSWMNQLNELRRFLGHPLKRHVSGYEFSIEERKLLRESDKLAQKLAIKTRRDPR